MLIFEYILLRQSSSLTIKTERRWRKKEEASEMVHKKFITILPILFEILLDLRCAMYDASYFICEVVSTHSSFTLCAATQSNRLWIIIFALNAWKCALWIFTPNRNLANVVLYIDWFNGIDTKAGTIQKTDRTQ